MGALSFQLFKLLFFFLSFFFFKEKTHYEAEASVAQIDTIFSGTSEEVETDTGGSPTLTDVCRIDSHIN